MKIISSRFIKTLAAFAAVIALLIPAGTTAAAEVPSPKEEVVYGLLNHEGGVKNIYVVNIIQGAEIVDYGSYSEIRNMTSREPLYMEGDLIKGHTTADKLYYQGTLKSKELPWDFKVSYSLDGKELSGPKLVGKSGELELRISVKENPQISNSFFDSYALQIIVTLDTKLCENIRAEGATIAEAGRNKQLNFTVLPGEGADLKVNATVRDFKMEPISMNGIRLNLGLDLDEADFKDQISQLTEALKKLDSGAGELLSGVDELAEGMEAYVKGLEDFKTGLSGLDTGIGDLKEGASALSSGLAELAGQNEALMGGANALKQAAFDAVNTQLEAMGLGNTRLTPENYRQILSAIPSLAAVKQQLDGVIEFTEGLKSYTEGVNQLKAGASDLADGVSELKTGSSALASSAKDLYDAGVTLNAAIGKLRDGLAAYKDGTGQLLEGTSGYDEEIEKQIKGILDRVSGSTSGISSFVSPKNTKVSAVQFVMKTEAIRPAEVVTVAEKPKKLNFWQKLLRLFGLY